MRGENSNKDGKYCTKLKSKTVCIICSASVCVVKDYYIKRHQDGTHKEQFSRSEGKLREEKLENMNYSFHSAQKSLAEVNTDSESTQIASQESSYYLFQTLVKEMHDKTAENVCPGQVKVFRDTWLL